MWMDVEEVLGSVEYIYDLGDGDVVVVLTEVDGERAGGDVEYEGVGGELAAGEGIRVLIVAKVGMYERKGLTL